MSGLNQNPRSPRFRPSGNGANFETEQHLEWFFCDVVLAKLGLTELATQYSNQSGICDILAKGTANQLVIVELKNVQDNHVIDQITAYFDALHQEQPFRDEVDYEQLIALYTVCPTYNKRLDLILKYHQLNFVVLHYQLELSDDAYLFTLSDWRTGEDWARVEILRPNLVVEDVKIPSPPRALVNLLDKCSDAEKKWVFEIRDRLYQLTHKHNLKLTEQPKGQWIRFQRTKARPIAEMGWDNQRSALAVYLWLPFTTVGNLWSLGGPRADRYKRTAMMQLWIANGCVTFVGYIKNQRRSWLIVTPDEIERGVFPRPKKLKGISSYNKPWHGLAMEAAWYLEQMQLTEYSSQLSSFIELAVDHLLQRMAKH